MRLIIPRIGSELMTKFRGKKPTKQKNKRTNNKSNTINKFQSSGWKPPTLTTWRCWCDVTIVRTNQRQSTSATLLPSFENQNSNFKQTKWNNEIIEIDVMKSNQWQNQWNHRLKVVEYPRPPIGLWRHPLLLPLPHPFLNFLNFWPCLALPPLPWGCLRFPKATTPPPPLTSSSYHWRWSRRQKLKISVTFQQLPAICPANQLRPPLRKHFLLLLLLLVSSCSVSILAGVRQLISFSVCWALRGEIFPCFVATRWLTIAVMKSSPQQIEMDLRLAKTHATTPTSLSNNNNNNTPSSK